MMGLRDVVAAVFYLAGGRIGGLARLQAVMYILHRETRLVDTYFETRHTVPWSRDVEQEVEELMRDGSLSVSVDETHLPMQYTVARHVKRRYNHVA